MFRLNSVLAIFLIATALGGGVSIAQTPSSVFSPNPAVDRGAEKSRLKQEEDRRKWSACRKQARAEKVKLRRWNKYMNDCMAR